jgi:hypothetical protein
MPSWTKELSFDCVLPGIGNVSLVVKYFPGNPGNYWNPPDPDEVEVISSKMNGVDVVLDDDDENLWDIVYANAGEAYADWECSVYEAQEE